MPQDKKPKSPVQILMSHVDNIRNENALIRQRVENLETSLVSVKEYIKDQMTELYSQMEAARETMDEITSFFDELNSEESEDEEHEYDHILDQQLDAEQLELETPSSDLIGEDDYEEETTADSVPYVSNNSYMDHSPVSPYNEL